MGIYNKKHTKTHPNMGDRWYDNKRPLFTIQYTPLIFIIDIVTCI